MPTTPPRILATTNEKKVAEWNAISQSLGQVVEFAQLTEKIELIEIQGNATQVAITKALDARTQFGHPVLIEDSSFIIKCLSTKEEEWPGPLYSSVEKTVTNAGLCKLVGEDRRVKARITIAFTNMTGEQVFCAFGDLEGTMPEEPGGSNGMGYDTIFIPDGYTCTLAEMRPEEKNELSMRRRAIEAMFDGKLHSFPASMSPLWRYTQK